MARSMRASATNAAGEVPYAALNAAFSFVCPMHARRASSSQDRAPARLPLMWALRSSRAARSSFDSDGALPSARSASMAAARSMTSASASATAPS